MYLVLRKENVIEKQTNYRTRIFFKTRTRLGLIKYRIYPDFNYIAH